MIISEQARLIFIHIPKTAGTSVRSALQMSISNDAENLVKPEFKEHFEKRKRMGLSYVPPHMTLTDTIHCFKIDINDYRVLVSVRNPWERFISFFKYVTEINKEHPLTKAASEFGISRTIEHLIKDEKNLIERQPQHAWYNSPTVHEETYFLRTERLQEDMDHFGTITDIRVPNLKHLNKSNNNILNINKPIKHLIAYHENPTIEKFGYNYENIC